MELENNRFKASFPTDKSFSIDTNSFEICRPEWKPNISRCMEMSVLQTATLYQDYIITYGGDSGSSSSLDERRRQINAYYIPTNTWKEVILAQDSLKPLERGGHSACLYNSNEIIVFGGWSGKEIKGALAVLKIQNTKPMTIKYQNLETRGGEGFCRFGHTANICGNHMYVFAGRTKFDFQTKAKEDSNELWSLDLQNLIWTQHQTTGDQPAARDSHSSVIYKKKLFTFGGYSPEKKTKLGDIYVLDLESMEWEKLEPQIMQFQPQSGSFIGLLDHTVCIFGGGRLSEFASNVPLSYDLENNTLEKILVPNSKEIQPVRDSRGVIYKNSLIVLGGNTQDGYITTMHRLVFDKSKFEQDEPGSFPCNYEDLLFSEQFSDIQFLIEDEKIPAHRVIIATRCVYFGNMLSSGMKESHSTCIKIDDVKVDIFKAFLRFLYSNKIKFDNIEVSELHQLADKYRQKNLIQLCEERYLEKLNMRNLHEIVTLAEEFDSSFLRTKIIEFLKFYLPEIRAKEVTLESLPEYCQIDKLE